MSDQSARSGAKILEQIQPRKRVGVAHICMRPDLIDAWEKKNDELNASKAEDSGNSRLGAGGASAKTRKLAEEVRALEEQIDESDIAFTFESMSKARYAELCDENPPRDKNVLDFTVGYNREAVADATVLECLIDPVFEECTTKGCKHTDCGTWQQFLTICNPSEWQELVRVAQEVNEVVTESPKSLLASRILDKPASGRGRRAPTE
jgi:hypothetical protein